ncbi:MAG TPA: biosynthetic peptidoglycan transglycosylase, partial [Pseudonocardiaceae bacterium]|nr:biosynthetic peptidoglycan transglycosylase [Pseudonocardiaceae bacterium]
MSDQRHDGPRRSSSGERARNPRTPWPPPGNWPPERFGQARADQPRTSSPLISLDGEPELLTHPTPSAAPSIGPRWPGPEQQYGAFPGGSTGKGSTGKGLTGRGLAGKGGGGWKLLPAWRRWTTIAAGGGLVCILLPVLAFFAGWLFLSVPSPTALAADRKQVTTILASDGTTEVGRYVPEDGNRIPVSLSQVPMRVQNAVLAAEDRSFRSNPGFDVIGIARAAWRQLTGGSGGGSTITQQYIKVATGHDEYSIFRKFREMILAAKITKQESKDRILEDYLNTIYFGRGAYGIEAASQAYFRKDVQNLTVSEAAVL